MSSPEWPKWQFKDGRKRLTLPAGGDRQRREEADRTISNPVRLNSTESAMKRTKNEGEKATPRRRSRKSSNDGVWMSKESTQREIRARRSMNSQSETITDVGSEDWSMTGVTETMKKKNETALESKENAGAGGKNENVPQKYLHLPDPLSSLMLERNVSVLMERRGRQRRDDAIERNVPAAVTPITACNKVEAGAASTPQPSKPPRNYSLFVTSNCKQRAVHPRRISVDSAVPIAEKDTVENRGQKSTAGRRTTTVSPFGGNRDGQRGANDHMGRREKRRESDENEGGSRWRRATSEAGPSGGWITPYMSNFRSGCNQAGTSREASDKETTVLVRRESTTVVPPTPVGSVKEGEGDEKRVSVAHFVPPTVSNFKASKGRKRSEVKSFFFGGMARQRRTVEEEDTTVKPASQLSWGRLASAVYRKTSMRSEISIGSTIPGEFEEEEVAMEREWERMNSVGSLNSETNEAEAKKPGATKCISSVSLATTIGASSVGSVVNDSQEIEDDGDEDEEFRPLIIEDYSQPDEFEIKDTVQDGEPKPLKLVKSNELGLFRRPFLSDPPVESSPPPLSRYSSGGSTTSANPVGRRKMAFRSEDKLAKKLHEALSFKRADRRLLKHDSSSASFAILTVREDRSSGWGVSLIAHSRGYALLPGNTTPPEGSRLRLALPLECVLGSVAVRPAVL